MTTEEAERTVVFVLELLSIAGRVIGLVSVDRKIDEWRAARVPSDTAFVAKFKEPP